MQHIKLFELFAQDLQNHRESVPTYDVDTIELKYTPAGDSTGGFYKIEDLNHNKLGSFNVNEVGTIPIDPDGHFTDEEILDVYDSVELTFDNSAFFSGGFVINYDKHKQGIGKAALQKFFMINPDIENVFLYAVPWQGSIPFWHNIGGETILEADGKTKTTHYIQLKRENVLI